MMKFDVLGGGFKTNRESKTEIRKAVSSKKIQRLPQFSERKIGSVLVGPSGSRLWRGTEQARSATALSVFSSSVFVFPWPFFGIFGIFYRFFTVLHI